MFQILEYEISANGRGDRRPGSGSQSGESYNEWYQVNVNGKQAAYNRGADGNHTWLIQGTYNFRKSISGTTVSWSAGKQNGTVDVGAFITIEDGYVLDEGGVSVKDVVQSGTNSQSAQYDNLIITITVSYVVHPETGETLPIKSPTEEPTEAPTETPTEDVPLADVPKTGDLSTLWTVLSSFSAGGLILLNKKRKF